MKFKLALIMLLGLAFVSYRSLSAEVTPGDDVKCPVSGKAVNKDKTVDYNGGKVFFCCENCPKAFSKDTTKFAAKANHQLVQTGQLKQTACPLSGKPTKEGKDVTIAGVKVGFCCENCQGKVAKMSEEEQVKTVFTDVSKSYKAADAK